MSNLVTMKDHKAVTTSLNVSETFEKIINMYSETYVT